MNREYQKAIEVGYGTAQGPSSLSVGIDAATKALSAIHEHAVSAVLVYTSSTYHLEEVLKGISSVIIDAPIFGTTTAGEICGELFTGTVSVVVLASPFLRVSCGIGTAVSKDWQRALDEALETPAVRPFFNDAEYKERIRRNGRDYFVMLFTPGITCHSPGHGFEILEALKEKSGDDFPVMGGGSADDWRMEQNHILFGQQAYPDSILLVVFETELQFGISLTHGFQPSDKSATVTASQGYEVLTIDGEIAVDAYSRLIGTTKEELLATSHPAHLTGSTLGISEPMGQHTVNIVDSITPWGGIHLTRPVTVGTVLTKMDPEPTRLVQAGAEGIRNAALRGGITDIALGLVYDCSLRPKILGNLVEQEFAGMHKVLSGKPLVGFASCGEIGVAADGVSRFNSSAVACLVLGEQLSQPARIIIHNSELLAELELQTIILDRTNHDLWQEISERKKTEEALRESEMKLRTFAQAVPDVSMILDEDGRYVEVFGHGRVILGNPQEDLTGLLLHQKFPKNDADIMLNQITQTIFSGTSQFMVHEFELDGENRIFEMRMAPMKYLFNGKKTVAAVGIDITDQIKSKRLLKLTYELRRRSDFLNDIITGNIVVDKNALANAKEFGIDLTAPLFCCILVVEKSTALIPETGSSDADTHSLKNNIVDLLATNPDYLVWDCREGIAILCQAENIDNNSEDSVTFASCLKEKIRSIYPALKIMIGISNRRAGLDSVAHCYRQARIAVVAARCQDKTNETILHFCKLGVFQLLADLGGQKQAVEFVRDKLGKLIDYDNKKGMSLMATLEELLQSPSLKEAASKMFLHYKTVVFRKKRIEEILGVSLEHFETRVTLSTAIKLLKLGSINDF